MTRRRFWCPGRVNLIGEHTDYLGGLALPLAIDLGIALEGEASSDLEIVSEVPGVEKFVLAAEHELALLGRPSVGFTGRLTATLPAGVGLSSSAAVELVTALALCAVAEFELAPIELVLLGQRIEQRATGVPCGALDQAACTFAKEGHASLLDLSTLSHRAIPFPADLSVVVVHSGVSRILADSRYGLRRRELEEAADGQTSTKHLRRLRHFETENERVRNVAAALESGPVDPALLGRLLLEGHASLRDDFEVSIPEIEMLVRELCEAGAYGARMVGGGFGGCVVALVGEPLARAVALSAAASYSKQSGRRASTFVTAPAAGLREL
jgi:galactokinase